MTDTEFIALLLGIIMGYCIKGLKDAITDK